MGISCATTDGSGPQIPCPFFSNCTGTAKESLAHISSREKGIQVLLSLIHSVTCTFTSQQINLCWTPENISCPTKSTPGYCRWNSCPSVAICSFLVFNLRMNDSQPLNTGINHNLLPFLSRKKIIILVLVTECSFVSNYSEILSPCIKKKKNHLYQNFFTYVVPFKLIWWLFQKNRKTYHITFFFQIKVFFCILTWKIITLAVCIQHLATLHFLHGILNGFKQNTRSINKI